MKTWSPIVVVMTNGAGGSRTHVQTIFPVNLTAHCYVSTFGF